MVNNIVSYHDIETPDTVKQALTGKHLSKWQNSMEREYEALIENKTWSLAFEAFEAFVGSSSRKGAVPSSKGCFKCIFEQQIQRNSIYEAARIFRRRPTSKPRVKV